MLNQYKRKRDEGFTIIEVMIVLAIAGLIMLIVFLAVPALQRSSRNEQRKTDANNTLSALSNYISNNGGQMPANCNGTTPCTFFSDVKFGYFDATTSSVSFTKQIPGSLPTAPTSDQLFLYGDAKCADATKPTTGDSSRQYVAWFGIEGSTKTQCVEG